MLEAKPLNRILFLDIETTSQSKTFADLNEKTQKLFLKRFVKDKTEYLEKMPNKEKAKEIEKIYSERTPIYAEWGKILCISVGVLIQVAEKQWKLKVKSFYSHNEKELLTEFINKLGDQLSVLSGPNAWGLCAHNLKVFDAPFIAKRLIVNGIALPPMFDFGGRKPWDLNYLIDTKEVWKFSVFDGSVSLDILANIFNVPSSKDDIDGSQVKDIYYKEKDGLDRIVKYCEKDVLALARIYFKMKWMEDTIDEIIH